MVLSFLYMDNKRLKIFIIKKHKLVALSLKKTIILGLFMLVSLQIQAQLIKGTVIEEFSGEPVPAAVVLVQTLDSSVVKFQTTDGDGMFEIKPPGPDFYIISIRKMDYSPTSSSPIRLKRTDTLNIEMRVLSAPQTLDAITVEGERIFNELDDAKFYDRKRSRNGKFLTREELYKYGPIVPTSFFRTQPNVNVSDDGELVNSRSTLNNNCKMSVFVDNFEVSMMDGFSVDLLVPNLDDIVGVEIYSGIIGVPNQYKGQNSRCGTVLIWTRMVR